MGTTRARLRWVSLAVSVAALGVSQDWPAESGNGVVVESVEPMSAAQEAGLRPGDVLLSWTVESSSEAVPPTHQESFGSPFDVLETEVEYAPRGRCRIDGDREGRELRVSMPAGPWSMVTRPRLPEPERGRYLAAREMVLADSGPDTREQGLSSWAELANEWKQAGSDELAAWLLYRIAEIDVEDRRWEPAVESLERALEVARTLGDPRVALRIRDTLVSTLVAARELEQAVTVGEEVVRSREELAPDSLAFARSLDEVAFVHWASGNLDRAEELNLRGMEIRGRWAPDSSAMANSLWRRGMVIAHRGDFRSALETFDRAVAILEGLDPDGMDAAKILMWRGLSHRLLGDLDTARKDLERSLAIQERREPTLLLPSTLNQLGVVLRDGGDLDGAEPLSTRALEIQRRLDPDSPPLAVTLNSLGILATQRGDLARAQEYFEECLEIRSRLSPGGSHEAAVVDNLGVLMEMRGDLAAAERYMNRALEIRRSLHPDHADLAISYNNLGMLAAKREHLDDAEDYFRRSLEIAERATPGGVDVAWALRHLADLEVIRGDLATAESYLARSMEIHRELNPESLEVARNLTSFGLLAWRKQELDTAKEYFDRALAIQREHGTGTLETAGTLWRSGKLAHAAGDSSTAESSLRQSLEIRRALRPFSDEVSESAHALGVVYRETGRSSLALEAFEEAMVAVESQRGRLGGSEEARLLWAAKSADVYQDAIDLLVDLGKADRAFEVVERSRARGLLDLMSQRDLIFSLDVGPDLQRRRFDANASYDAIQARMAGLDAAADRTEIESLTAELREARREQARVADAIREASPRLASLQHPEPLDLDGVKGALDPGTVLLSYTVGDERTLLFAVGPTGADRDDGIGVSHFEIALGREALQAEVAALRDAIVARDGDAPADRAARLYDALVAPAEALISEADRVVISPDAALHTLPFAALIRYDEDGSRQYLVEWKPVHAVASMTVFDGIKSRRAGRRSGSSLALAAFGNPTYGATRDTDAQLEDALRAGLELETLPWSGQEVASIAELYPESSAVFVGKEATEERARAIAGNARFLHFACHSALDARFPLNSSLVLTLPEPGDESGENGLLQAWEIFESLRIDADLVALSACETGLGRQVAGEGLIGLRRAFTYAGAQTVLASLWAVADRSTSELMKRFYGYLEGGMPKDEALRAAQLDLIRGNVESAEGVSDGQRGVGRLAKGKGRPPAEYSAPFYWAAFQLFGDWR